MQKASKAVYSYASLDCEEYVALATFIHNGLNSAFPVVTALKRNAGAKYCDVIVPSDATVCFGIWKLEFGMWN